MSFASELIVIRQDRRRIPRSDFRNNLADGVAFDIVLVCDVLLTMSKLYDLSIDPVITLADLPNAPDPVKPDLLAWCHRFVWHRGSIA